MSELTQMTSWDFTDLGADYTDKEYPLILEKIDELVKHFVSQKELLSETIPADTFVSLVKEKEILGFSLFKIQLHAYLKSSQNTQDEMTKQFLRKTEELSSNISNKTRFFHQWFIKLPQEKAYELADAMGDDAYVYKKQYDAGKHVLSEKEENILSLKDTTGSSFLISLYDSITSKFSFDFDGKTQTLTQMRQYMLGEDRQKRKEATQLIKQKFSENMHILGDLYQTVTKDYVTEVLDLRKYESVMHVRARKEDITVPAVLALMDAAKESNHIFQDFFKLKAKYMKLDTFELYDSYAPIVLTKKENISYDEAITHILAMLESVSPQYKEYVIDLIKSKRIDSQFHEHKRSGAFNYGMSNGYKPFVFMQYLGEERDMFTLAHELGHAIHSMLTKDRSSATSHPSIGIAESASTFLEEMLAQHLFDSYPKEKQIELLFTQVLDAYQTIQRQIYISIFEKDAHEMIQKGTTNKELHDKWTQLQKEQFSDSVSIDDELISWSYIPHIYHTPFYCYNYGIGLILAMIFVEQYNENKEEFLIKYNKYLSAGGSMGMVDTAKIMGVDLEDPATWKRGYGLIEKKLAQLKDLLEK